MMAIKTRHTNIVAVFLIAERDNKVLLLRRYQTGYCDGDWDIISGHVEAGETAKQAVIREAQEEAGILVEAKDLEMVHVMHRKSIADRSERVDFYFKTKKWEGQPKINEPEKCSELLWADTRNLPSDTIEYIELAIRSLEKSSIYSEFGW